MFVNMCCICMYMRWVHELWPNEKTITCTLTRLVLCAMFTFRIYRAWNGMAYKSSQNILDYVPFYARRQRVRQKERGSLTLFALAKHKYIHKIQLI